MNRYKVNNYASQTEINVPAEYLGKARKSSLIAFPSSVSTTSVPGELLKGRYDLFHASHSSNGKSQRPIGQRPYTAFKFNERHIHTSVSSHLCSEKKEKTDSDKKGGIDFRKNEQFSFQNNKLKVNNLNKKRSFYKLRHQNLVWDVSNKGYQFNKYKMSTPVGERNKELSEKKLNDPHSILCEKSEMNPDVENQNNGALKTQDSSVKNVLTIDILTDTNNTVVPHSPQFLVLSEDNINGSTKINNPTTSAIENSNELISVKGVNENRRNNWKIINSSLVTKSTIKDCKKTNLTLSNHNKDNVPKNESVLRNKYDPHKLIKNMNEDNSILFHNKEKDISGKKSTDIRNYKITKNSLQNNNSTELIMKEDSKSTNFTKSKSVIIGNKDDLDGRNDKNATDGEKTVWNTIYKQNKAQMILNDLQYRTKLTNKIKRNLKNIDLNHRNKITSSINSILRPVKSKTQILNKRNDNKFLSKNVNTTIFPIDNSVQNISQKMGNLNNFVMDNTLYLKSVKYGISSLNEALKNPINYNAHLTASKIKPKNKIQLIKYINSTNLNKKSMVTNLKNEIKSWKKYEFLKKVVQQSTSEIYQSIMNNRKFGKISKDTIYLPRKRTQKKCSVISIPLTPKDDMIKYKKTTQTQMKKNNFRNKPAFSSCSFLDPIITLNRKYKKNFHNTFNELLKKSEILICQEKFKKTPKILDCNLKLEFQTEKKSDDTLVSSSNSFKRREEKNINVFMKNAKKISLENKKPWVRYIHQMNDESKEKPPILTEISTYPSGCLKKPEFIIELLPLEDEEKNLIHRPFPAQCNSSFDQEHNASEKENTTSEKKNLNHRTFHAQCNSSFDQEHNASEKENTTSEKKNLNHRTFHAQCNSPVDQEHHLSYENFEEIEPKKNKFKNDSTNGEVIKVIEDCSKEFQTEKIGNNRKVNEIKSDSNCTNLKNALSSDNKTFIWKGDQFPANNIRVEVCSNIIYEQPIQKNCYKQAFPEENKAATVEKKNKKVTDSCIQETIPSQKFFLRHNQPGILKTDISKKINPMSFKKPSPRQSHAIEISISSSKKSVSEELKKSQETQIKCLTKGTPSKSESIMRSPNIHYEQLNSCENSDMNKYEKVNNSCISRQYPRETYFQHFNSDQNVSNQNDLVENINSSSTEALSKETIFNCSNQQELSKQKHRPMVILSNNEKKLKNRNITTGLETQETSLESDLQIQNEGIINHLPLFKKSNNKVENMISDIKEFNLLSYLKKSCSEISCSRNGNNKAFFDNIKEFFRGSYNYFKLDYPEEKVPMDKVLVNASNSKDMHNINPNKPNSFREINYCSKRPASVPESNKRSCISSVYSNFHQKFINDNSEIKPIKLSSSHTSKPEKKDTIMSGNEELQRRISNIFPVSSKGQAATNTKKQENFSPNVEISIDDLEKGMSKKNDFFKTTRQPDNIKCINNHPISSLNKSNDKGNEKFSINDNKKQRSFYNLNGKKSHMKFSSKNRLSSQRYKQRFSKANVIFNKNKHRGIHYPKEPLDEISNLMKRSQNSNKISPFNLVRALEPVKFIKPIKSSPKIKKAHSDKLYSELKLNLSVAGKSNLLKTLKFFQKSSEKNNPESYWLNCFSKNTEDKTSCNEFLAYIKKRKLHRKLSFKSND